MSVTLFFNDYETFVSSPVVCEPTAEHDSDTGDDRTCSECIIIAMEQADVDAFHDGILAVNGHGTIVARMPQN